MNPNSNPTQRFSNRIRYYHRYRPSYPLSLLESFVRESGLTPKAIAEDVGSGTGIFSELLLTLGFEVWAVEPNLAMRKEAEAYLGKRSDYHSLEGRAEMLPLADHVADLICAAQAAHWFDPPAARIEFERVLKPKGWLALIWNSRKRASRFMQDYEALLIQYGHDFQQVDHGREQEQRLQTYFDQPHHLQASHQQQFDLDGLQGRLLSSSYAPLPGDPAYEPMMKDLQALFDGHQDHGTIRFEYHTDLYFGRLRSTT